MWQQAWEALASMQEALSLGEEVVLGNK